MILPAVPSGWIVLALVLSLACDTESYLAAQDKPQEDVYLMDLGIIIEPGRQDSVARMSSQPGLDDAGLIMSGEAPGAAFIESTKELRMVLNDLSGKINTLENSLNQDMEAVRLENERLRELIQKLQTNRIENDVLLMVDSAADQIISPPLESPRSPLPEHPSYRNILQAYQAGYLDDVIQMSQALDESVLKPEECIQLAYWLADAYFYRGQFTEALQLLEKVVAANHELGDDAIVLQGLIYLKQGKFQEARSRFETLLSQYPSSEYQRLAELTINELKHL